MKALWSSFVTLLEKLVWYEYISFEETYNTADYIYANKASFARDENMSVNDIFVRNETLTNNLATNRDYAVT